MRSLKRVAHRLINGALLRPFGLQLSFRRGCDPIDDIVSLVGDGIPVSTIVDGGAHVGTFSCHMARVFPEAKIYAFEPTPETFVLLQRQTCGVSHIQCQKRALGAEPGQARFCENSSPLTNSLRPNSAANEHYFAGLVERRSEVMVEVTTLSDFARDVPLESIDILKLDLQGGEFDAIRGLGEFIAAVKVMLIEVQFLPLYEGASLFSDIDAHLRREGFALFQLYDLVRSPGDGRLLYGDALFVRQDVLKPL